MILNFGKKSKKLTKAEKERKSRLRRSLKASTQNSIKYNSLFEDGLMHIAKNEWSRTYRLGDVAYVSSSEDEKMDVIDTYAEALNSLDAGSVFQLLVINRRIDDHSIEVIKFEEQGDGFDQFRHEYNDIIDSRFSTDSKNFQVEKFVTIKTDAYSKGQADSNLSELGTALENQFLQMDITFEELDGKERLDIFSELLQGKRRLSYDYRDIALSDLHSKDFIAPNRLHFMENHFRINEKVAKVMYAKNYPTFLTDKLIKNLTDIGIEMAITVQAEPYEPSQFMKKINNADTTIKAEMVKAQRSGAQEGIDQSLAVSGRSREISESTRRWKEEIDDHDQKAFSGIIAVYFTANNDEELANFTDKVQTASRKNGIEFEDCYYHQEEGLNTVLPIGHTFLNVKRRFVRDMTTYNLATQVPFTNVDLKSESPKALYYGQNQLSNNVITVDRKADLNTGSGVVLGSSGSGKSVTVKTMEIIPTYLKNTEDRIIIVDPEDEYSDIGREFNAQLVDIFIGSSSHLNLMDLPDMDQLKDEDSDPIGDKSNLLMGLFESILDEVGDIQYTIIDRVTRETYKRFAKSDKVPTLRDWHDILEEQAEPEAKELALKSEIYAKGSQDIFAHETNVDITDRFVIFNLKRLTGKLKPFAMMVIQDYIWNQVVASQGKLTTRIYFDEVQLFFKEEAQAVFFTELYSRVRKYGAIATAITQNIETLMNKEEGRKLVSNSEFMILLKHKKSDLQALSKALNLTPTLTRYIEKPKSKGTGLIVAGQVIVPFENPIPKHTRLFKLVATDA
ncbi:TPA: ATP-binding protein [Streptococcus pyogenes]|uniref:VirB4-like conjugal transfer ATPase, CD1110 family n=1 Tax=Streptococcus dysgalactiae TaxID=1334 RepID=UPI002B1C82A8|nr:ATP-binding protein [Streptococcus pyogenes]HEP4643528.1 ATP-binding protein [Streptococcus pyogenes]HEP4646809.1 ATP-binding protein [Streptococcus pyogenes]HEP4648609.1 ATP-binding protein [Streptococcus pyogenes]HEP4650356.1 ATP-binding protein [Streptococcus pyogenes]